ncbi:MAG: hypothetical protein KDA50_01110 [Rhodobacteraceae bacterium]|nr:hypothetical protein [Paracoccaceae bacterium]
MSDMKNPWMSLWLSEYNKAANAVKGQMMAEMTRQQQAMMKEIMVRNSEQWMELWFPWLETKKNRRR